MERSDYRRILTGFWHLADPRICIASAIPMVVGAGLAFNKTGSVNLFWFLLSVIGIFLIETGKNAVNEYVDYKSGVDRFVAPEDRTPFSGGKKTIVDGLLNLKEVVIIGFLTFLAACAIGLFIVLFREERIFWIGLAGVLISLFYSLPPFRFCYVGLGELAVGITYGPLITTGMYMVLTKSFDPRVVVASLPIGFIIANVLWINQFPDYEADKKGGKMNWVVRLGRQKAVIGYALLFILAYISFIVIAIVYRNPLWILGFAGAPVAAKAVKIAAKEHANTPRLIPANAGTIQTYMITGIVMLAVSVLSRYIYF